MRRGPNRCAAVRVGYGSACAIACAHVRTANSAQAAPAAPMEAPLCVQPRALHDRELTALAQACPQKVHSRCDGALYERSTTGSRCAMCRQQHACTRHMAVSARVRGVRTQLRNTDSTLNLPRAHCDPEAAVIVFDDHAEFERVPGKRKTAGPAPDTSRSPCAPEQGFLPSSPQSGGSAANAGAAESAIAAMLKPSIDRANLILTSVQNDFTSTIM